MATKKKSKSETKKKSAPKTSENEAMIALIRRSWAEVPSASDRRRALLAQVAGSIAGHIVSAPPSPDAESSMASSVATIAVDIAEEILKRVGIPSTEGSAESASAASAANDHGLGAAS